MIMRSVPCTKGYFVCVLKLVVQTAGVTRSYGNTVLHSTLENEWIFSVNYAYIYIYIYTAQYYEMVLS